MCILLRISKWALLVAMTVLLTGCSAKPGDVALKFVNALNQQDWTAAKACLTPPSAELLDELIKAGNTKPGTNPKVTREQLKGDRATVRLEVDKSGGGRGSQDFQMLRQGGQWKLSLEDQILARQIGKLSWTGAGDAARPLLAKAKDLELKDAGAWFKLGMTLYDGRHYAEALEAFQKTEAQSQNPQDSRAFVALVWQGHVLDLQGDRAAALQCYRAALDKPNKQGARHDQYGMVVNQRWAEERLTSPFKRPQ